MNHLFKVCLLVSMACNFWMCDRRPQYSLQCFQLTKRLCQELWKFFDTAVLEVISRQIQDSEVGRVWLQTGSQRSTAAVCEPTASQSVGKQLQVVICSFKPDLGPGGWDFQTFRSGMDEDQHVFVNLPMTPHLYPNHVTTREVTAGQEEGVDLTRSSRETNVFPFILQTIRVPYPTVRMWTQFSLQRPWGHSKSSHLQRTRTR